MVTVTKFSNNSKKLPKGDSHPFEIFSLFFQNILDSRSNMMYILIRQYKYYEQQVEIPEFEGCLEEAVFPRCGNFNNLRRSRDVNRGFYGS
jgi:hypothetical protein